MESIISSLQYLAGVELELFIVIVLYSLTFVITVYLFLVVMASVYHSADSSKAKWNSVKYFLYLVVLRVIVFASGGDYWYLSRLSRVLETPPGGMVLLIYANFVILIIISFKLLERLTKSKGITVEDKKSETLA
ncbi:MAG: hypothetical protein ACFFD4_15435 [Candidatus Odinarchaeota archaeon]